MPSAFQWLRRSRCAVSKFECLRRFNGFAVSRFAVSKFECLRRLAYAELKVNFVEGFAVHGMKPVSRFLV